MNRHLDGNPRLFDAGGLAEYLSSVGQNSVGVIVTYTGCYVLGNPLTFVDPSGFQPAAGVVSQPGYPDAPLPYEEKIDAAALRSMRALATR